MVYEDVSRGDLGGVKGTLPGRRRGRVIICGVISTAFISLNCE